MLVIWFSWSDRSEKAYLQWKWKRLPTPRAPPPSHFWTQSPTPQSNTNWMDGCVGVWVSLCVCEWDEREWPCEIRRCLEWSSNSKKIKPPACRQLGSQCNAMKCVFEFVCVCVCERASGWNIRLGWTNNNSNISYRIWVPHQRSSSWCVGTVGRYVYVESGVTILRSHKCIYIYIYAMEYIYIYI